MPDPARPWSGDPPPRCLTSCYDRLRQPLRRPLEPGQYLSIKYTERLAAAGVEPSVGSVGDSYDNALAETINGLYKAELIHRRGPWRSFEALEFATLEWMRELREEQRRVLELAKLLVARSLRQESRV